LSFDDKAFVPFEGIFLTNNRFTRWSWPGLIAWISALVLLLYGSALSLPFMADDFFHLPFVDSHTLPQMWQMADGLYYFRPLSFTLWKLMEPIFGYHNPAAQHALNLALHVSNALLVAWLAGCWWAGQPSIGGRRFIAGTLYALFPFSYEAVPWVGALVHPLVTFLILAILASYARFRLTGRRRWAVISLVFTFLSPFAHENGVLVVPLLGLIEFTMPARSESLWRSGRRLLGWLAPLIVWFAIWRAVPAERGVNALQLNSLTNIGRNLLYFTQGAAYPVTWLGGWVRDTLALNDFLAAVLLSGLGLAVAGAGQWRGRSNCRGLLPWLWIGLTSLPALLFLGHSYLAAAPRTLMLSSVGIAWLWTDVFVRLAGRARRSLARLIVAVLLIGLLLQNTLFIQTQLRFFQMAGSIIRQTVAATVAANDRGQAATFINLPVWLAAPQVSYAIGQEGVVLAPAPDKLDTLVTVHTGRPADIHAVRFEAIRSDTPYYTGLLKAPSDWTGLIAGGEQVFVTRYSTDTIALEPAGAFGITPPATLPVARYDQSVALLEASAATTPRGLHIDLMWQVRALVPDDVTAFVHVLDANGQLIAQADGDPIAGTYPFTQWPRNLVVRDIRLVNASEGVSVRVGLYSRLSGERLTARSTDNTPLADNAATIQVH
jgi:hypothetical protein